MRCVSYTRTVSCMESGEIPKDIISQQNQKIQDYIKKRGWTLGKKYSDRRKDAFEETAYLQMKMDAIAREFDCVVMDSMFRCGRNSNVAAEMLESMFVPAGIHFAVVEDDFCSCDVSKEEVSKYLDEKATAYRNKFTTDQIRKHNETKIYPKYGFLSLIHISSLHISFHKYPGEIFLFLFSFLRSCLLYTSRIQRNSHLYRKLQRKNTNRSYKRFPVRVFSGGDIKWRV